LLAVSHFTGCFSTGNICCVKFWELDVSEKCGTAHPPAYPPNKKVPGAFLVFVGGEVYKLYISIPLGE